MSVGDVLAKHSFSGLDTECDMGCASPTSIPTGRDAPGNPWEVEDGQVHAGRDRDKADGLFRECLPLLDKRKGQVRLRK